MWFQRTEHSSEPASEMSIIHSCNVELMMNMFSDCAICTDPSSFLYWTLQKLCMANRDVDIRQRHIRMLMECSVRYSYLLKQKKLDFELQIPRSFKPNYNLYQPITVPKFHRITTYNRRVTSIGDLVVLEYVDSNVTDLLDAAQDAYGLITCSGS